MSNVSSVDLDELRKAREELNKEAGIENDPDMYKDYNPNREVESKPIEESQSPESVENNYENITPKEAVEEEKSSSSSNDVYDNLMSDLENSLLSDDENEEVEESAQKPAEVQVETPLQEEHKAEETHSSIESNLGKFDAFAAFEVKENAVHKPVEANLEKIIDTETSLERTTNLEKLEKELSANNLSAESEESYDSSETDGPVATIDSIDELELLLNSLLEDVANDDSLEKAKEELEETEAKNSYDLLESLTSDETEENAETEEQELENEETESSTEALESLEEELLEDVEAEEQEQPVRKDILGALMNRGANKTEGVEEQEINPLDEEAEDETKEPDESFNLESFALNENIENEEDKELEEIPQKLVELNVDPVESFDSKAKEETEETSQDLIEETKEVEDETEESAEEQEVNPLDEEAEDKVEEEKKEENLEVGIKDIGRILGRTDEEEKKEEFVESTEYFDPTKARPSNKVKVENTIIDGTEIITDYSQLREILQKELKESEEAEQEKIEEIIDEAEDDGVKYALIEEFKFINEIATDEFKSSDKFSYIMGKNERGDMIYGNFREHHNLAVFCKNDLVTKSFLNSLVLSLCLKNDTADVNFVMIDSDINSTFEVYNKSSYLYFNRIAKTNKEILDTLIEITKELDARYEKLASTGMSGIDQYNDMAHETQTTPMPHLIVVFNNYTDVAQATYADKINACLYQILKFGRIVGIFVALTAKTPISSAQVNYNLSSRLSFKSDRDSKFTVGVEGVEKLPDEADAIYFNIAKNTSEHIKTPTVTDTELDLIIKELEDES